MLSLKNQDIGIFCEENGQGLVIIDFKRGTHWSLDEKTLVYGMTGKAEGHETSLKLFKAERAEIISGNAMLIIYKAEGITFQMVFQLGDDYVEVRLPVPKNADIGLVSVPGSFKPDGETLKLVMPIMQGMLWDGRGPGFETRCRDGAHTGFSMSMAGYMGNSGGLLLTAEAYDDTLWWFGKDNESRIWCSNLQISSLGSLRYERSIRLYPTDADIVSIAKKYRKRVIERGRFINWDEKIAERPGLERLFGALMCFSGYCKDDIDYVAECGKLKAYGFDRALIYPVRFNTYDRKILMGGEPPVDLSREQIEAIKSMGYDVAPWSWINEAVDNGTDQVRQMYRKMDNGERKLGWQIDEQRWYTCCTTFMEEYQKSAAAGEFSDMTWDHFDVITCATNDECYEKDHPNHLDRYLSRSEDREWIRRLLIAGQTGGRAVSSESFNDAYSLEYDIGSVKAWPQYGHWPFWPIPLTMLVYHDSMVHSWWELHNYNYTYFGTNHNFFQNGSGKAGLMAALDALMGCPPHVMPFGAQYMWTGSGKETALFKYRFEDPEVQVALKHALPVTQLHKKIGKLEMVDFKILTGDGNVQQSTFADGTNVVANFSNQISGYIQNIGYLQGESWKVYNE